MLKDEILSKFNIKLGEYIKVGVDARNTLFADKSNEWLYDYNYIIGQVVGTGSDSLIVAFEHITPALKNLDFYGCHNAISIGELSEEFKHLYGKLIFRKIFDKEAFKPYKLSDHLFSDIENKSLDLVLGDKVTVTGISKDDVLAEIVGFSLDGNPLARITSPDNFASSLNFSHEKCLTDKYIKQHLPHYRYWFLSKSSTYKDWKKIETSDLKIGNEVLVGFDANNKLITDNSEWVKSGKAKIIDIKSFPFVTIEYGDVVTSYVLTNKNSFFKTVNGKVKGKGEKVMENNKKFLDMVKGDATEAAYRVGAKQITKGSKTAIMALLAKQGGSSDGLKAFAEMMDTEIGEALLSSGLGMAMTYVPIDAAQNHHAQKLAEEFRINGMSTAGNAVFETAMEYIMPVISGVLSSLPPVAESQARVASNPGSSKEEYIEETTVVAPKQARV